MKKQIFYFFIGVLCFLDFGYSQERTFDVLKDEVYNYVTNELRKNGQEIRTYDHREMSWSYFESSNTLIGQFFYADPKTNKLIAFATRTYFYDENQIYRAYQEILAKELKASDKTILSLNNQRIDDKTVTIAGSGFYFEKGYFLVEEDKFNTPTGQFFGIVVDKLPVRNKRGKVKKYNYQRALYSFLVPIGESYSEAEAEEKYLNKQATSLYRGLKNRLKEDLYVLDNLPLSTQKDIMRDELEEVLQLAGVMYFLPANYDDPNDYIWPFTYVLRDIYNLDFVYKEKKITFTSLPEGVIAQVRIDDKPCELLLDIDSDEWAQATFLERTFIIYHELGHDALGLNHNEGVRLMATNQFKSYDAETLGEMIHDMFSYFIGVKRGSLPNCTNERR